MATLIDITNRRPAITGPAEHKEAPRTGKAGGESHKPDMFSAPEGLQGRKRHSSDACAAPRQKLPRRQEAVKPDADTQSVIAQQEQQSANSRALAIAIAKATDAQAMSEFIKSMAETHAKNIKSAGEGPKNLA
jgi:hypothetical protein